MEKSTTRGDGEDDANAKPPQQPPLLPTVDGKDAPSSPMTEIDSDKPNLFFRGKAGLTKRDSGNHFLGGGMN